MFRAVERTLARTMPNARSAFVGRVLADPAFVQKTMLEAGIAFTLTFAHELHVRGRRVGTELHAAMINSMCMAAAAATCSALVAPAKTPSPPGTRFPFQRMLLELPNNAFEVSTPTRRFAASQRVSTFVTKAVELSAVYAVAGGVSVGLQQCVNAARTAQDPKAAPVTPVAGISRTAGGLGVFGALGANTRLQAASGLERVLLEYAKVSTTWQVVGLATLFRGLSLAALENPLGLGPKPLVSCSRPALAGEPAQHIPSPQKKLVRRRVRRVMRQPPVQPPLDSAAPTPALQAV
jgi:Protein RETICULATA-related